MIFLTAYEWKSLTLIKLSDLYETPKERRIVESLVRKRLRSYLTLKGPDLEGFKRAFGITGGRQSISFATESCLEAIFTALGRRTPVRKCTPTTTTYALEPLSEASKIPSVTQLSRSDIQSIVSATLEVKLPGLLTSILAEFFDKSKTLTVGTPTEVSKTTYKGEPKQDFKEPGRTLPELVSELKAATKRQDLTEESVYRLLQNCCLIASPWCRMEEDDLRHWDDDAYLELLHRLYLHKSNLSAIKGPVYRNRPKVKYIEAGEREARAMIDDLKRATGIDLKEDELLSIFIANGMHTYPWLRINPATNNSCWDVEAFEQLVTMCREGDFALPRGQVYTH